jgi:hypothetical protein
MAAIAASFSRVCIGDLEPRWDRPAKWGVIDLGLAYLPSHD